MMFIRQCPECGKDIKHNSAKNLRRAIKTNRPCRKCGTTPEAIEARRQGIRKSIREGTWVNSQKGVKQSPEHVRKRLESRGINYAEGPSWTQGTRGQYNNWARKVKEKDNRRCVYCGSNKKLHAHHILSKHKHPEWSLFVNNGITLCHDCHWDEHRINKYI